MQLFLPIVLYLKNKKESAEKFVKMSQKKYQLNTAKKKKTFETTNKNKIII